MKLTRSQTLNSNIHCTKNPFHEQDNIPAHKVEEVERQWRQRFFQQIKVFFGYGAVDGARLPF